MSESDKEKIEALKEKIVTRTRPKKIILFGSYAWGSPGKESDIDLLIINDGDKPQWKMTREVYEAVFDEGEAVDALVYTSSQLEKRKNMGDPFIMKIINNGKVIYGTE